MQRTQKPKRRVPALATTASVVLMLLAGPLGTNAAAAPTSGPPTSGPPAPAASAAPGSACPVPVPVTAVTPGLTGTGWTVSRGSTPEPFTVTVLGVLPNAIGSGVDLIVFEGDSPALDAAGGIWAGMSGSPVYTVDGRLLGAVAYGFTSAPSKIGGITPAAAMLELLAQPNAVAKTAPPARVPLPAALRRDVLARGTTTEAQAAVGLAPLPIPLAVSGLNPTRLAALNADFERSGSPLRAYAGSAASGTPAPAGSLFPGSNFAAAISYGDVTMAAIGTTTAVCQGQVLAFGHPMLFAGPVSMSAHRADAIAVVKDPAFGSFKLATVGAVAGTVDQDRLVGLRAAVGPGPAGTVPITSTVRLGTQTRSTTSWVTLDGWAADAAAQHLMSSIDRVYDRVGAGRVAVGWNVRGTRSDGPAWRLTRTNQYASLYDASWDSVSELANQISAIVDNPFSAVKITSIALTATVRPDYGMYTVDGVQAKQAGSWVELTDGVVVDPGQPLELRIRLTAFRAPARVVSVRLDVPAGTVDGGSLTVTGTYGQFPQSPPVSTFPALLAALRDAPRNNYLDVTLQLTGPDGTRTVYTDRALTDVVTGIRSYPVASG